MSEPTQPPPGAIGKLANTRFSRRHFVKAAGIGGVAAVAGMGGAAHVAQAGSGVTLNRPRRKDDILFLVNRTTQGYTQEWYEYAKSRGYANFLEQQLAPQTIDDSAMDQLLTAYPSLGMSYGELYANYTAQGLAYIPYYELKLATIARRIGSNRQLFERMVEFWSDHFSIDHNKDGMATYKTVDDREVIRQHALGRFPDMLVASAHSGAMMVYLDNYLNTKYGSNENYAREIMELHTLGVDGGYTETDIKELARCLTGWGIDYSEANNGKFYYYDYLHDQGSKVVLGYYIGPGGGKSDMDTMLQALAYHPSTAKFIAKKMCRWLLAYEPPQWLVDRVADTYMNTLGDIKAMIRVILDRDIAKEMTASKFKRPGHVIEWLVRATKAEITDLTGLFYEYYPVGHMPFDWSPPNGYPDRVDAWLGLQPRWNFVSRLFDKQVYGTTVKPAVIDSLLGDIPDSELAQGISRILTGGVMSPEDVAEIQGFLDAYSAPRSWPVLRQALALAAQCASAQYY
ncbi:MAG: DUF1800 domain-containing protein [Planctomycetota bacterium]